MKSQYAWQPVTPAGVACFAGASLGRLLVVQLVVALAAAGVMVWFVSQAWFPVVTEAIGRLPAEGALRAGMLDWRTNSPMTLAEGYFLTLAVDLDQTDQARSLAHIDVVMGRTSIKAFSLLGYVETRYPVTGGTPVNQSQLEPWWGAWRPPILGLLALGVVAGLLLVWCCLATLYAPFAWLMGFFANKNLSLAGGWRLAGAALMPGAIFMTVAIVAYGLRMFDLLKLGLAVILHFVVGWVYLVLAPTCLPNHPETTRQAGNPFSNPASESASASSKTHAPRNPFVAPPQELRTTPEPNGAADGDGRNQFKP